MPSAQERRVAWPVERWPRADQAAWLRAQQLGNPMAPGGAAAKWRPASRKAAIGAYGRWLAYLSQAGQLDATLGPAANMTADKMRRYREWLQTSGCAPVTIMSYVAILGMMVKALAPKRNWRWLDNLHSSLKQTAEPIRDKRHRIVPIEDLAQLGLDIMTDAEAKTNSGGLTRHTALAYRDGLLIALLATRPLRQKNYVSIEIGRQLAASGNSYVLSFPGSETKGKKPLEFGFPAEYLPMLRCYLNLYRPYLLELRNNRGRSRQVSLPPAYQHLWVTQYGTPFSPSAQVKAFKKYTVKRFGHYVNPHLFRDCAVTSIAINDPDHVLIAAQILGHTSLATTEKYYILAQSNVALGGLCQRLATLKATAKQQKMR